MSPIAAPPGRRGTWMAYATWGLFAAAVAFSLGRTVGAAEDFQWGDFGAYYRAGRAVARGESPYRIDQYGPTSAFVYAPAYAYLFTPLSALDHTWAVRLWMLMNWGFCLACIALGFSLVAGKSPRPGGDWVWVWLAALPLANYFWANVRVGQAGALMGALCLGWAACRRGGRPFMGGLLLAGAVAVKVAPAVLLPYLLVRRDWRGLAGVAAGGLALFAVPAPWVGWEGSVRLHLEWPRLCQQTQVFETYTAQNQSLLAALARLPAVSDGNVVYSVSNLRGLESAYPLVVLALAAVLYAWIFWRLRDGGRPAPEQERRRDNLHLALMLVFMALVSPRGWTCNFVVLIVAAFLAADDVRRRAPGWGLSLASLALVAAASATPRSHASGGAWSLVRWVYQAKDFLALLAVAGAVVRSYALRARREGTAPLPAAPPASEGLAA